MDAKTLLISLVDDAGGQLSRLLEGFPAEQGDAKIFDGAFSMNEALLHLAEVYRAAVAHMDGATWEWGSYEAPGEGFEAAKAAWIGERQVVRAAIEARFEEPKVQEAASMYVIGHDYYHVGQLVSLRLFLDPNWNSYVIYGE